MTTTFKIAVFPGDNCGPEVMAEAIKVISSGSFIPPYGREL